MSNLVSVILTSYNHADWIGQTIESILSQSYKNLELLIVDDASSDNSVEVIEAYAQQDSRIKYEVFEKNQGAVSAAKRCYEMSSGEYICIMSSDDIWLPNKLEYQLNIFSEKKEISAVFGQPEYIDQNGKTIDLHNEFSPSLQIKNSNQLLNHLFLKGNCLCHPTLMIKRECYETVGFYDPRFRNLPDCEFWTRLAFKYEVFVDDKVVIKFRRHSFNESGQRLDNIIRTETEYGYLLENYTKNINSIADLLMVFPEEEENIVLKDDQITKYYLAQIALRHGAKYMKIYAAKLLYNLLEDQKTYQKLYKSGLYSYTQFHELGGKRAFTSNEGKKILFKIPYLIEGGIKLQKNNSYIKLFKK